MAAPEYEGEVSPNAVMLIDAKTGAVLYEKNADGVIRPASTTKIMTCIVALENSNLDDVVKVGPEGDWTGSGYSLLGTKNGEEIVMRDLLYGLMLVSGNDAAEAVAVHVAGSVERFVSKMNRKAEELGMTETRFHNPHGTDTDGHVVTARDMSILALYAMQNETFMDIVGTASYDMPATNKNSAREVLNTNHLLRTDEDAAEGAYYEYATGIKTGSTPKAFRCLVSAAEKDGMALLCLIFGDETEHGTQRWPTAKSLFEFGFSSFRTVDMQTVIDTQPSPTIKVSGSENDDDILSLNVRNTGEQLVTMDRALAEKISAPGGLTETVELYGAESLAAPLGMGDVVGLVTYRDAETNEVVCQGELSASRDVSVQSGEVTIEITQETERPANATPQPTPQPESEEDEGVVIGLGWLWIALGVVLLALIVVLVISLVRGSRR